MKTLRLLSLALLAVAACGPKDIVPTSSTHPENPQAPSGMVAALEPTAAVEPNAGPVEPGPETLDPPADDAATIAAAEQAAYERAKPVFEKYCAKCHSSTGKKASKKKLAHFNMDTYPFSGEHSDEIGEEVRKMLGVTGKKPKMPKDDPGAVQGQDLDLIVAWSKAFDASHGASPK